MGPTWPLDVLRCSPVLMSPPAWLVHLPQPGGQIMDWHMCALSPPAFPKRVTGTPAPRLPGTSLSPARDPAADREHAPGCHPAQSSRMVTLPAGETGPQSPDAQDWPGRPGHGWSGLPRGTSAGPSGGQVVALLSLGIVATSPEPASEATWPQAPRPATGCPGTAQGFWRQASRPTPQGPSPEKQAVTGGGPRHHSQPWSPSAPHLPPCRTKVALHPSHDLGEPCGDLDSASATYFPASLMRKVSKTVTVPELTGGQREVSFPLVLTIFI